MKPVAVGSDALRKFRELHDLNRLKPVDRQLRGVAANDLQKVVFQAVGIRQSGRYFKHQCKAVHFLLGQFLLWPHQKVSRFLETFAEAWWELVLFVLADTLHRPVGLPDHVVSVSNGGGVGKADSGYLPKVWIHVRNKVFYLIFR